MVSIQIGGVSMNKKLERVSGSIEAAQEMVDELVILLQAIKDDVERLKGDSSVVDVIRAISEERDSTLIK